MTKKLILLITIIAVLGVYDLAFGFKGEPKFYVAPNFFCESRWVGITLPPVGVFLCPEYYNNERTRRHELIHWDQYKREGTLGFYIRYTIGWARAGFSYTDNWMEVEARQLSGDN